MPIKGIEITVLKEDGTKVIAGFYNPFTLEDIDFTNADAVSKGVIGVMMTELVPLKEKLDRQERLDGSDSQA